ncbi:MAG: hypothetical protein ABJN14_18545 [Paracoccaceae bacterium]
MLKILSKLRFSLLLPVIFLLAACNEDKPASVGFWKENDNNYIEIIENQGVYGAVVYRPSSWDSTFEKEDYAATFADGVLSIGLPQGPLPVLHKPDEDVIVLFGDRTYARVDADTTRSELTTRLRQIALDVSECEDLQSQINVVRGTFENNAACKAFMTPITARKPNNCSLLFTSCNSF